MLEKQASLPYYLANAAAGGLGGYLMTDVKKDRLRNALIGTALGGLAGPLVRRSEFGLPASMALGAMGGSMSNVA